MNSRNENLTDLQYAMFIFTARNAIKHREELGRMVSLIKNGD